MEMAQDQDDPQLLADVPTPQGGKQKKQKKKKDVLVSDEEAEGQDAT